MHLEDLYPLSTFRLEKISQSSSNEIILRATSLSKTANCPYCNTLSKRRHSSYIRRPQASPCCEHQVRLMLTVNRYFCENPDCSHRTFVERLPETVQFYAHRTKRLNGLLNMMAFEMSAEAAARVSKRWNIQVSPDTILRLVRNTDIPVADNVRILGIDDWALKKGQNYGTILIDLEKRRPIELLPDRTKETLGDWLQKHPEIEIITRDRSFEFRLGIDIGAPQALQIVDRWHLLHNLREKLQETLPKLLKKSDSSTEQKKSPTYQKRQKYFDLVQYLAAQGHSQRRIARVLGISRGTVIRYLSEEQVPDWQPKSYRPNLIDPYEKYLRKRWQEGCWDVTTLWKELQQLGYDGRRQNVYRFVKRFEKQGPLRNARQLVWLFLKDPEELLSEERDELRTILNRSATSRAVYDLVQEFLQMLTNQSSAGFDEWLLRMEKCGVKKIQNFAVALRQDYAAVKAALAFDWSNGQVEGQVNRLKTIKRQMYGRAKLDLLRARVLGPP